MARSTKLDRLITDPLNTRLTTAEAKVATIETRGLVELGDNISGLNNDAGYQNATQVDAKITAVVGAAPDALDTLQEIATALADDDSAIAALVAQDTANSTAIAAVQAEIEINGSGFKYLPPDDGENPGLFYLINELRMGSGLHAMVSPIEGIPKYKLELSVNAAQINIADIPFNSPDFPLSTNLISALENLVFSRNVQDSRLLASRIDRVVVNPGDNSWLELDRFISGGKQHIINNSNALFTFGLPLTPEQYTQYEVINNENSNANVLFAGETITPGNRHAVQYDGVEWVIL